MFGFVFSFKLFEHLCGVKSSKSPPKSPPLIVAKFFWKIKVFFADLKMPSLRELTREEKDEKNRKAREKRRIYDTEAK
jgi:hypothetical protein